MRRTGQQQAAARLSVALKQSEQAQRNLRTVELWATKRNDRHLAAGTLYLADRMAQLTGDLRSLITIVRARTESTTPHFMGER